MPQLEVGLASTQSWSCLDFKLVLPRLLAGLPSTGRWSCLEADLALRADLALEADPALEADLTLDTHHALWTQIGSILFFRNWLIWTLFTPSLLLGLVIAASYESLGQAPAWLA